MGEEYVPLGHTEFSSVINKIKAANPDCIYSTVVGGSNVAFYTSQSRQHTISQIMRRRAIGPPHHPPDFSA